MSSAHKFFDTDEKNSNNREKSKKFTSSVRKRSNTELNKILHPEKKETTSNTRSSTSSSTANTLKVTKEAKNYSDASVTGNSVIEMPTLEAVEGETPEEDGGTVCFWKSRHYRTQHSGFYMIGSAAGFSISFILFLASTFEHLLRETPDAKKGNDIYSKFFYGSSALTVATLLTLIIVFFSVTKSVSNSNGPQRREGEAEYVEIPDGNEVQPQKPTETDSLVTKFERFSLS